MKWKCNICQQTFEAGADAQTCPICGAPISMCEAVAGAGDAPAFVTDEAKAFVIVGGGCAAKEAAAAIRERSPRATITLISQEDRLPYSRPALSDYIAGEVDEDSLTLDDIRWYGTRNIALMLGETVVSIDTNNKRVTTDKGTEVGYDKLLLAVGAEPFIPCRDIEPGAEGKVFTIRTLDDANCIIAAAGASRSAVLVGGGVLGLEAARALLARGVALTVVEYSKRLMINQLDAFASEFLSSGVQSAGVDVKACAAVTRVTRTGVVLSTEETIECDMVIFSAGVRSRLLLASSSGIAVERGIVVDGHMRTSVPDVYAAGDCAQLSGRVPALWSVAAIQGAVAGANMAGEDVSAALPLPSVSFEGFGIELFSAGAIAYSEDMDALIREVPLTNVYRKVTLKGGRVVGGILLSDVSKAPALLKAIDEGAGIAAAHEIID